MAAVLLRPPVRSIEEPRLRWQKRLLLARLAEWARELAVAERAYLQAAAESYLGGAVSRWARAAQASA